MADFKCGCGNTQKAETVKSFFSRATDLRVTVCDKCAVGNGLVNEEKFISVSHSLLTTEQNFTPAPDGNN